MIGKIIIFAWAALACSLLAGPAFGHPHAFVDCSVCFVFDRQGLVGFWESWVLDKMLTASVMDIVDADHDYELSPAEALEVEKSSFSHLKEYNCFTHVLIDGREFEVKWVRDFAATLDQGRLIYRFFVPCHVSAGEAFRDVRVAVFDQTFYTSVAYGPDPYGPDPGGSGPARVLAQGLLVKGDLEGLQVQAEVRQAPDMAYYSGQVVPRALVLRFRRR
ncbi:MAG: DUF1007 family protein [Desulfovibrionaceae bacterium]|nr:DUF1007 family protein [Desulfovibrionaceae bacterium]